MRVLTGIVAEDCLNFPFKALFKYLLRQQIKDQQEPNGVRNMNKAELQTLLLLIYSAVQAVDINIWLEPEQK